MHTLYPAIKPYATHFLKVDAIHELYVEESGSPDGIPVLYIHGGPGAGTTEKSRRFFDPEKYRIVVFDQRGCGHSKPHLELQNNTTQHLLEDIEKIRKHLEIEDWILFGGSWGSTLSLVYAQAHPSRVKGLILRGIFLARQQELDWLYKPDGVARIFPDHWAHFEEIIPEEERSDMLKAYHSRLMGDNELARMNAAKHWSLWEGRISTLRPNHDLEGEASEPHFAMAIARIEAHYFVNNTFLKSNQIIRNMGLIDQIPGIIIHGRYDMICPLDNAVELASHWTESELQVIRDAGHAATEPSITDALVRASDKMASKFDD